MARVGADVEIIEEYKRGDYPPVLVPNAVRVNGVDVGLIERGSVVIHAGGESGPDRVHRVELTLMPRTLSVRAERIIEPAAVHPAVRPAAVAGILAFVVWLARA